MMRGYGGRGRPAGRAAGHGGLVSSAQPNTTQASQILPPSPSLSLTPATRDTNSWGPIHSTARLNPNWGTLALAAMDALYSASPQDALFLVSGTGQTRFGLNWGNGFITNPATLQQYNLSDPNPFFRELVRRPYLDRVVLGPHCYPPSITGGTFLGQTLWDKLAASFGYLQTKGYCPYGGGGGISAASVDEDMMSGSSLSGSGGGEGTDAVAAAAAAASEAARAAGVQKIEYYDPGAAAAAAAAAAPVADGPLAAQRRLQQSSSSSVQAARRPSADCARFPVIIGEFGSMFEQASDVQWMNDFAAWVGAQSSSVGAPLGWAYWAVNANSGDTGGIVSPNWQTFMWVKLRFLQEKMGLKPWYAA